MKKLLLFVFALTVTGAAMGQKAALKAVPYSKTAHPSAKFIIDNPTPNSTVAASVQTSRPKSTRTNIDTIKYGSSINAYTMIYQEQTCIWYDQNLDALMATYRGNSSSVYPKMTYLTGNDLVYSTSTDGGNTWIKKTGIVDGTRHRYPSGVIHNPAGNTDINNTYACFTGPQTDGNDWTNTYEVSVKYDGTNLDNQIEPNPNFEALLQGLTATEDGRVHFCGDDYLGDYTSSTFKVKNGLYNAANTIDWTSVDIPLDDVITRKTDNTLITYFGDAHMAWNNDGSVGYVFVRGSDIRPDDKPSWVPIIFKTLDGGETWNQLPYFDFSSLSGITDWILPIGSDETVYKPMFTEMDMTVDMNGKPHIFACIRGAASGNIDSLTYIWTVKYGTTDNDADNNYFEVWQDAGDNWHAWHIDTCWTDEVPVAESWYTSSSGNVGWDHRLQASRSYDGAKVFATWGDSDYEYWGTKKYNLNPDLFVFGRNLMTSQIYGPTNATEQSDLWGISFFNFTAPVSITHGPGTYEIPVTVEDISSTGQSADNPTYHMYVKGVAIEFEVGMNENSNSNTRVSDCYPNPSDGKAFFNVTLGRNSNVAITITNVSGQKVSSGNFGLLPQGNRKLSIDNSNLNSGVYFLNILVGDQKFTNKMIVK